MSKKYIVIMIVVLLSIVGASGSLLANDEQTFVVSVDNIAHFAYTDSGVFNTPVGSAQPGPALPGSAYQWTFHANPGDNLSFATMFVQSNDWFFAPDERGIPLYHADGSAMTGNVTDYVKLWDSGTEVDQPVGTGADQAPRQSGANVGAADPHTNVRRVLSADLPATHELIDVNLSYASNGRFTVRINNISGNSKQPSPLAPGVGVVHSAPAPLFINGEADLGYGLEGLAEDGNAAGLAAHLAMHTGINTPLAPVAWTVHTQPNALFTVGQKASPGLETLAEDGGPASLVAELDQAKKGAAAVGRGASGAGPILAPDGNYSFEITAVSGEHLSLATMFVQSNDWFFSLRNIPLFDANGKALSGDVTHLVNLYDAGTEINETPGFGANQAPRQAAPNTGPAANNVIHSVTGYNPANYLHITITPVN